MLYYTSKKYFFNFKYYDYYKNKNVLNVTYTIKKQLRPNLFRGLLDKQNKLKHNYRLKSLFENSRSFHAPLQNKCIRCTFSAILYNDNLKANNGT